MLPSPLLTFPQWAKFACTFKAIFFFFCLLPALLASSRVMLKFQKGMIRRVFSPFSLSQATSVSHHTAPLPGVGSDEIRSSVSKCFFKLKMSISSDEKCASRCPLTTQSPPLNSARFRECTWAPELIKAIHDKKETLPALVLLPLFLPAPGVWPTAPTCTPCICRAVGQFSPREFRFAG